MKRHLLWVLPLAMMIFAGCGSQADSNKPIEEIKAEVEGMSVNQLESKAKAYVSAIEKQTAEMDKVKEQLKELSPKELLGERAKSIKDDMSEVGSEIKALTERYNIYANQYKKAGGDISKIQLS